MYFALCLSTDKSCLLWSNYVFSSFPLWHFTFPYAWMLTTTTSTKMQLIWHLQSLRAWPALNWRQQDGKGCTASHSGPFRINKKQTVGKSFQTRGKTTNTRLFAKKRRKSGICWKAKELKLYFPKVLCRHIYLQSLPMAQLTHYLSAGPNPLRCSPWNDQEPHKSKTTGVVRLLHNVCVLSVHSVLFSF